MMDGVDVRCDAEGSMVMLTPISEAAREWIDDNVSTESWQWLGAALCIEHRYAQSLIVGMREAGFKVSTAFC